MKIETLAELAEVLGVKLNTLYFYAFLAKDSYKDFNIQKRSGASRKISAPINPLKYIQRRIVERILKSIYKPPADCVFGLDKKGFLDNAILHKNSRYIFNLDLKDFFPSISSGRIRRLFELSSSFEFSPVVSSALCNLVCHNGSLPQGAPTSPILANMICFRLDKSLSSFAKKNNLLYSRYFDDLTFSSKDLDEDKFMSVIQYVRSKKSGIHPESVIKMIIEREHFNINQTKLRLQSFNRSQWVTGVKVNVEPNVARGYIRYIRCVLHDWEKNGYTKAEARFKAKHYSSLIQGLGGMIRHVGHVRTARSGVTDPIYLKLKKRMLLLPIDN